MADVNISKYRASVVREGSRPATPGFVVSEGQDPVDPAGNAQNHLPVTIAPAATGLSITESQILSGAGTVAQYIRGDGSLADFPESSGGGSSVSYYLNGSINQGTIGGVAYKELSKVPILGAGTDFTINADGYIASFITDAGDPNLLEIPGGNWNFETYFSASSGGGSPTFYVELYKVNSGGTATLIASSSSAPELIAFGTNLTPYFSSLAVPTTTLALTDRLAVRYYVTHSGRTITLHTENNHLCQIITTFTTGLTALNGLTAQVQNFAVGTSGTDFNIASSVATHTFNLPTATSTIRGALSSADWSTFNGKQNALTLTTTGTSGAATLVGSTLNIPIYSPDLSGYVPTSRTITINGTTQDLSANRTFNVGTVTSVGLSSSTSGVTIGSTPVTTSGTITLAIATAGGSQNGLLSSTDWTTFNSKQNALTNPVTGTGTTNYLPKFTGSTTIGNSQVFDNGSGVGINTVSPYTATNFTFVTTNNTNGSGYVTRVNGTLSALIYSSGSGTIISEQRALPLLFETSGNTRATLDSNGNLGLGVTPSAWSSAFGSVLQFKSAGSNGGGSLTGSGGSNFRMFANTFYDGSYKYIVNGAATQYEQDGYHAWLTAPSGTAGNAISFTQAMTLTSGGNLLVGTTTDNGARLQVSGSASVAGSGSTNLVVERTGSNGSYMQLKDGSGNSVFLGANNGDFQVQTPSGGFTNKLVIANSGAATFSSSVTAVSLRSVDPANTFSATFGANSATPNWVAVGTIGGVPSINGYTNTFSSTTNLALQPNGGNVLIGNTSAYTSRLTVQATAGNRPAIKAGFGVVAGNGYWVLGDNYTLDESLTSYGIDYSSGDLVLGSIVAPSTTTSGAFISTQAQFGNLGSAIRAGNSGDIYFFRGTSTSVVPVGGAKSMTESMRLNSSGNLLIGTNSDNGARLQVNGHATFSSRVQSLDFISVGSLNDTDGSFLIDHPDVQTWKIGITNSNTSTFSIGNDNGGAFAAKYFNITNSGNVGIGGTNADSLLTINGTAGTTHERFREGSTTIGFIGGANGLITGQSGKLTVRAEAGLVLSSQGNSPDVLITSGNVLIGTTTDNGAKLNVNGTIRTANPTGSTSDGWLLGRALVSGSSTPDRWIRVQIGNLYYDILSRYIGSV